VVWIIRVKFLTVVLRYFSSPLHTEWLRPMQSSVKWTLEAISLR
jgi:hypothetical protein